MELSQAGRDRQHRASFDSTGATPRGTPPKQAQPRMVAKALKSPRRHSPHAGGMGSPKLKPRPTQPIHSPCRLEHSLGCDENRRMDASHRPHRLWSNIQEQQHHHVSLAVRWIRHRQRRATRTKPESSPRAPASSNGGSPYWFEPPLTSHMHRSNTIDPMKLMRPNSIIRPERPLSFNRSTATAIASKNTADLYKLEMSPWLVSKVVPAMPSTVPNPTAMMKPSSTISRMLLQKAYIPLHW